MALKTPIPQFRINPSDAFANVKASIRRPKEITTFSYDDQHRLRHDSSSLRWYWPPSQLPTDLSNGFEAFIKHDDTQDEHLDGLLSAMIELEKRTKERCAADFVTWRGMMTKIMCAPFDLRNGFEMNATLFQDTIFIEENHSYKMMGRQNPYPQEAQMSFWGYKFETLSTIPKTWAECTREEIESRDEDIVNNKAQFCSIVRTGFDKTKIILGGEVDAIWGSKLEDSDDQPVYVELKTSKEMQRAQDHVAFERKMMRFWAQSFLLGVSKIIVGFRDQNGILQRLEEFKTAELPGIASSRGRKLWDGNTCINFAAKLLEWLKETITGDGVWRIRHEEHSPIIEVFQVDGVESFLTKEFLDWRLGVV